jgi:hypothetical protein
MENKLISMGDFVLEQDKLILKLSPSRSSVTQCNEFTALKLDRITNYANFLKQPLTLSMFVPCDEDGNILEFPEYEKYGEKEQDKYNIDMKVYLESKDRVLFEGFYVNHPNIENDDWTPSICYANILHVFWKYDFEKEWKLSKGLFTIQDLCKYNLPLTETALKNYKHD